VFIRNIIFFNSFSPPSSVVDIVPASEKTQVASRTVAAELVILTECDGREAGSFLVGSVPGLSQYSLSAPVS